MRFPFLNELFETKKNETGKTYPVPQDLDRVSVSMDDFILFQSIGHDAEAVEKVFQIREENSWEPDEAA